MKKHSLEISVILAIIILLLLSGCGTRKTDTQQRDSVYVENNYSQGSKIVLGNTFIYKPFDVLKPMVIQGKEYKNVIISNDKTIVKTNWKNRNITKTITLEKQKSTIKKDNANLWIGLFFIFGILIVIFLMLKKYKIL